MSDVAALARYRAAKLAVARDLCEQDFAFFVRYFFKARKNAQFVFAEHHNTIISDLMDVYYGRVQNLILNCPPRYGKTELVVVLFAAWCYVKNPRCEFIHLSYADKLALENSSAIREVIRSAEFRELWPHITLTAHKDAKEAWATVQGGAFLATSTGGQVTGFGAGRTDETRGGFTFSGCLLIDDPQKPDDARHETLREGANRRWTETIQSRRNSPRTPTICVMQRLHKRDFTQALLDDVRFVAPDGDASRSRHRKMPALIDDGLPTERALWPAKHTVADLKAMRDQRNERGDASPLAGETFSGQYQQDPTPADGGIIKRTWWRRYSDREQVIKLCTFLIITADTAYTSNTANDPTSLQVWGFQGKTRAYLLDSSHGWWEFPELVKQVGALWARWPQVHRLYIESKASGPSLGQTLRNSLPPGRCKVILWRPTDYLYPEDKVGRMKEWSRHVHGGCVWVPSDDPEDASYQPWVIPFVDEHDAFSADDTHAHDDRCDASTMAGSVWVKMGGGIPRPQYNAAQEPQS
jgi:predicted phage terminase large subunit-like protein